MMTKRKKGKQESVHSYFSSLPKRYTSQTTCTNNSTETISIDIESSTDSSVNSLKSNSICQQPLTPFVSPFVPSEVSSIESINQDLSDKNPSMQPNIR